MTRDDYKWYLKDSRWIVLAKYVKKRDGVCQYCGNDSNLNAHHLRYISGRMPWDYPEDYLITLCKGCHEKEHKEQKELTRMYNNMKLILKSSEIMSKLKNG